MEHPDWYADWRHEAFHELQAKNERLQEEFRIGEWPRYDYDLENGTLTFSADSRPALIADIQLAGCGPGGTRIGHSPAPPTPSGSASLAKSTVSAN